MVVRWYALELGRFEVFEALTMKEDIWMLETWLWEVLLPSYIISNLLQLPKCPLKG
jgi:hypothetical protein